MAHIPDYVSWRGDITFKDRGFRIEDNLVLSDLVYIDFMPVVEGRGSVTLREAIRELDSLGLLKNTRAGSTAEDLDFARLCGESIRFGNIRLIDPRDEFDSSDKQFAAITYILDDGLTVIGFRGTDATITGWKEDFMISYTNVPSQYLALEYTRKHMEEAKSDVIILGHSKGAHLALYSAAHLENDKQEKLMHVYMNDGPGFCNDVLDKSLIDNISKKTTKITPEYSIIGRLFEPEVGENIIVRSSATALLQHSILTWLISEGKGLVTCTDHAPESHVINENIERFVEGMDLEARENFIEVFFNSMAATGASTIREFAALGPAAFEELIFKMAGNDAMNLKGKAKKLRKEDDENLSFFMRFWGLINRKQAMRIGLTLFLSALCFAFPDFAMETVVLAILVIFCIYEAILTIRHLMDSEWNFRKERPRVMMCIVLLVVTCMVLVKEGALFVISSVLLGIFFLSLAYQNVINFRIYSDKYFERFRCTFEGIVTLFLGVYILLVPDIENRWYMLSCGYLLFIDAIFETLKMIRDRKKGQQ